MKKQTSKYSIFFIVVFVTSLMLITTQTRADYELPTDILWDEQFDDITSWSMYPGMDPYHSLDSYPGVMYTYEDTGHTGTAGFAVFTVDLSSWTQTSDLNLKIKFRARSNYGGGSVTNFYIGLRRYNYDYLWCYYQSFASQDSGWQTRTVQVPKEELNSEDCSRLILFVGYSDAWSTNWQQRVDTDYITLEGDKSNTEDVITQNDFDYYDQLTYESYWALPEDVEDYHSTSCSDGIASVYEDSGHASTDAVVYGLLDLNSWTGCTDLKIQFRIRARSDYNGQAPVTNYLIGIADIYGTTKWYDYDNWLDCTDSGWVTRSVTIPEEDIELPDTYQFFWGYYDYWSYDWDQQVDLQYFKIYGDKYPEENLRKNKAGITTEAETQCQTYSHEYDTDEVYIAYCSKAGFENTLGFGGDNDVKITGAMEVSLDPDEYYNGDVRHFNWVDEGEIKFEIKTYSGYYISDYPSYDSYGVNIDDKSDDEIELSEGTDIINLALDALALAGPLGGQLGFLGKLFLYSFSASGMYKIQKNKLYLDHSPGIATARFDFVSPAILRQESRGSTDFKMRFCVDVEVPVYMISRVTITYSTTIKHVYYVPSGINQGYWEEDFVEYSYSQVFDYIHFPSTPMVVVALQKEKKWMEDIFDFIVDDDSSADIDTFEIKNGEGWLLLTGVTSSSWIETTVVETYNDDQYVWYFTDMKISHWKKLSVQTMPVVIAETKIKIQLNPTNQFYRIFAGYIFP